MSIVRLWQSGLETGDLGEFTSISSSPQADTGTVKTGTYSLKIDANNERGVVAVPSTRQIRIGIYFYPTAQSSSNEHSIISVMNSGGTQIAGMNAKLSLSNYPAILDFAGTDRDTASGEISPNEWNHYVLDVKIDPSSGWGRIYKNGNEILSYDGDTGNSDIEQVAFGRVGGGDIGGQYFDDMYIDDLTGEGSAQAGPILRFYSLTPNADGNYSQWLGSDGDSTNNYLLVDDVPPSDADYVEVTGTNKLDSYNMSTFTLDVGEVIEAIIPIIRTKRTSTTEQIILGNRLSSTDFFGSTQNPDTSFGYLFERFTGTPSGADWQQSDMDNVELLIMSTGTY